MNRMRQPSLRWALFRLAYAAAQRGDTEAMWLALRALLEAPEENACDEN